MTVFVFTLMLAAHVFADITLQGALCNMKQRSWWADNVKRMLGRDLDDTVYSKDYMAALAMHSVEWAVVALLPMLLICSDDHHLALFARLVLANSVIHGVVDSIKANAMAISLVEDQLAHVVQLCLSLQLFIML